MSDTKDNNGFTSIGKTLLRKEDRRLLTGQGRYLDDIQIAGELHACFIRSPYPHALISSIEINDAIAAPGVVAVVTGKDLAEWTTTLRLAPPIDGLLPIEMTALPMDKVRFHGDPVACVVATDRYLAEDAAELVYVDYEPLNAVSDMFKAMEDGTPLIEEDMGTNLISHQTFETANIQKVMDKADRIVESTFATPRQTHLPIETRGCIAEWDEGTQHLTMHVGNQAPHPYRSALAGRLSLKESQVTVIVPDVGGGFGQKIALYREELVVAALARQLKRPVRWREDRMENLLSASHAREDFVRTRASVDASGRITGLTLELVEDFGAYCFYPANYLARVVAMILTGPYDIGEYAYDVKVVLTNKCGNGPMRAPMAIASWVMEGTIDNISREFGLDPVHVRRLNMVADEAYPHTMATGETMEDINPGAALERGLEAINYNDFRQRQEADREHGIQRGLGICSVVESTTYGSKFYKAAGIPGSGHECAWVKVDPSGEVRASAGVMATGQGYETAFSQAVAEGLGVDPENVAIKLGNTDVAPYGMGSRGARGGTAGGGTIYLAAVAVQQKALAIAAKLLDLTADHLTMRDGRVCKLIDGNIQETDLTLSDIARTAYLDPTRLPDGMEPGLEVTKAYDPPPMTYSNSCHLCEVVVDVPTGVVKIERYIVVENCGNVLNPQIVEGQQLGAVVMGLSGALFEHMIYDKNGYNQTGLLADYLVATALDIPNIEIISVATPNRRTPVGLKGMAEGGVMGAIGVISNAVSDALNPFGIVVDSHPISPARLRGKLRNKS
ncbi:MAG: xanthine dehydrogenase family protein molybdopterin-binding subunit [Rhodospirillales bacterium]|nr:xanthine dehydrogenase family protein molybdopterin-binding subunit [Rhodospirillales bacterium]